MPQVISDIAINYTLTSVSEDILTFTHENGQDVPVRIVPRVKGNKLTLFEQWQRVRLGRDYRLLTERGFEIVFEIPFLFEYYLEENGYPTQPNDLVKRFFEAMNGATFRLYPRALFK